MIYISVTLTLKSGNSRIVSETQATILISFLFHTSNIPWDSFNSMTNRIYVLQKTDQCILQQDEKKYPQRSYAYYKIFSVSVKSDIQILVLYEIMRLITHLLLWFGNCAFWCNFPAADHIITCFFCFPYCWSKNPTSLNTHFIRAGSVKLAWLFSPFEEMIQKFSGKLTLLSIWMMEAWRWW